jgi:hypothetical protein
MDDAELVLKVEEFASLARDLGDTEVEQFWNDVAAKLAESIFRNEQSALEKEAVWALRLNETAFKEHLLKVIKQTEPTKMAEYFSTIGSAANAAQQRGVISPEQADMIRRVTNELERELNDQEEGSL